MEDKKHIDFYDAITLLGWDKEKLEEVISLHSPQSEHTKESS